MCKADVTSRLFQSNLGFWGSNRNYFVKRRNSHEHSRLCIHRMINSIPWSDFTILVRIVARLMSIISVKNKGNDLRCWLHFTRRVGITGFLFDKTGVEYAIYNFCCVIYCTQATSITTLSPAQSLLKLFNPTLLTRRRHTGASKAMPRRL